MLDARPVRGGVLFARGEGHYSPFFRVFALRVLRITPHIGDGVPCTKLGIVLPVYVEEREAWLMDDSAGAVTRPDMYNVAIDPKDRPSVFRAIQDIGGGWHRLHNLDPRVVISLTEWPVNRW